LHCDISYVIYIILLVRKSADSVQKATKKDGEQMTLVQHIVHCGPKNTPVYFLNISVKN